MSKRLTFTALAAAVALVLTVACGRGKESNKPMNTVSFTPQQAACMSVAACLEARGEISLLADAIDAGFDAGITVNQYKEAFSQLYAYTGFPRSLNALATLDRVITQRYADSVAIDEGEESTPLPRSFNPLAAGTEVQTRLVGKAFDYQFCPAEDYYLKAHLFGDIFGRDGLSHAERELVTVSALSGVEGAESQLRSHVRGALNMGVTDAELRAIPEALHTAGLHAEALRCQAAIAVVADGKSEAECATSPSVWPLGEPNNAYAQYFVGQSYLAVMDGGLCNVTFEPACRNNWHVHHGAVQVLVCVSGRGWYQEWGKAPVELRPGVTVAVPAGVKHWHGAAADSWMQHLTYHTDVRPGNRTEWLEPVDDQAYAALHSHAVTDIIQ